MPRITRKPVVAVVSPFVDKEHGTERCVAEQIERLARHYQLYLYSNRVRDTRCPTVIWRQVKILRGPETFRFLSWLVSNFVVRFWDRLRGIVVDLTYSPGANCFAPDIISVHAVFANVRRTLNSHPGSRETSLSFLRGAHRRAYYRIAALVEKCVYRRAGVRLLAVSEKTERDLTSLLGTKIQTQVIYLGVDTKQFSASRRQELRPNARKSLALLPDSVAILLVGNSWIGKGLNTLLDAVRKVADPRIRVLFVGADALDQRALEVRDPRSSTIVILPQRADIEFYFAAADIYASPSLEDSFALPVLEAMACGLPAVTSRAAGVSELIHHGDDGLILEDPRDSGTLATYLRTLIADATLRERLGANAARTASQYSWERNAEQLREVIDQVLAQRQLS